MGSNRLTKEWIEVLGEGGLKQATVTKTWIEVLAKYPTNKAQTTKYWIEVLGRYLSLTASDSVTFVEDLDYEIDYAVITTYEKTVSDTLTFTEVTSLTTLHNVLTDTLAFTEVAHPTTVRSVLTDTLSLVEVVVSPSHSYVIDVLALADKLNDTKWKTYRQLLKFTETVDNGVTYVSDNITLAQNAKANIKSEDVYEVCFLTEILVGVNLNTAASDAIVFIEAVRQNFHSYAISDVFELIEQIKTFGIHYRQVVDTLTLDEQYKLLRKIGEAIDNLVFAEKLKFGGSTRHSISDTLVILEQIQKQLTYMRDATQTLSFGEVVAKSASEQLTETITFIETLLACEYQSIWQGLILAESLSTNASRGGTEQIVFAEAISRGIEFNRSLTEQPLEFSQTLSSYVFKDGRPKQTSLTITAPPYTPQSYITVAYPSLASPTFSFTLKSPALQNTDEIEITRISRTTRTNERDIYNKTTWPKIRRFKYSFDNVCADEMVDMRQFLINTLGFECELLDYEGNTWLVFIESYNPDISESYPDRYSFDLVFRRSENI